jgi:hypothetical protein
VFEYIPEKSVEFVEVKFFDMKGLEYLGSSEYVRRLGDEIISVPSGLRTA